METIKLGAFKIKQPVGEFFVAKINYKDLVRLASKDMSEISKNSKNNIYQRKLDENRKPSLKKYMEYSKATFPNGIILNAKKCANLLYEDGKVLINDTQNAFFIIDGQHRIEALKMYNGDKKFELCIIIFNDVDLDLQTEIFATVNGEQKAVNPTVNMNLKGNDNVDTPDKIIRDIAILLNGEENSPFYNMIKIDDTSKGILSMSALAKPLLGYIYDLTDYYNVKDYLIMNNNEREGLLAKYSYKLDRKIFWEMYCKKYDNIIYGLLFNYFTAIKNIFSKTQVEKEKNTINQWNNKDYVLTKTLGYNALIELLKDIILKKCNKNFKLENFTTILKPLEMVYSKDELITQENYGAGLAGSNRLYKKLYGIVFGNADSSELNVETMYNFSEE